VVPNTTIFIIGDLLGLLAPLGTPRKVVQHCEVPLT
jgi:hypothetical protein